MSLSKNRREAERWLLTAEEDLEAAILLRDARKFSQCCFLAQQSGEKAVKALWYLEDADPWGHSIQRLVTDFPLAVLESLIARFGQTLIENEVTLT
jgi:HEPN domain-containing protein